MSAQIIAALRRRADRLEADAKARMADTQDLEGRLVAMVKAGMCLEFRKLADEAEGQPPTSIDWE